MNWLQKLHTWWIQGHYPRQGIQRLDDAVATPDAALVILEGLL